MSASVNLGHVPDRLARSRAMRVIAAGGFTAEAVIYGVIGVYALLLATGHGGGFLGATDAPRAVKRQPFGDLLLVLLGLGLACHALWRLVEAFGRRPESNAVVRAGKRAGSIIGALVAAALAVTTFQHLVGRGRPRGSWLHHVLRWDGGDRLVIALGVGVVAAGLAQVYVAYTQGFRRDVATHAMTAAQRRWLLPISRFGIAARGVVLVVAGGLLVLAGADTDARRANGTGAALWEITRQTGSALLLIVAAGGLYAALVRAQELGAD